MLDLMSTATFPCSSRNQVSGLAAATASADDTASGMPTAAERSRYSKVIAVLSQSWHLTKPSCRGPAPAGFSRPGGAAALGLRPHALRWIEP
jgi:hypothetical protein